MQFRHEAVTAGASQLLLPWIELLLSDTKSSLKDLDAIAIGIGPGAFTGVRLGIAAVQGLAVSQNIPVVPICSLDAIAAQILDTAVFKSSHPQHLMIAIDARMEEVYWASYDIEDNRLPKRIGDIYLTKPEDLNLEGVQLLAGSALNAYPHRLPQFNGVIDSGVAISALGILKCAQQSLLNGLQCEVRQLEPLYVRDKVAFTTAEREEGKS